MKILVPKERLTRAEWLSKITRHVTITPQLREVLDGLLLSDASLQRLGQRGTAHMHMEQSPKRLEWLEQLQVLLEAQGLETKIDFVTKGPSLFEGRVMLQREYRLLRSYNYAELVGEHSRWYAQGMKHVPPDLRLSPVVLTHWFCGDGRGGDQKGTLGLCTDGFSEPEVDFLVGRLFSDLGIYATKVLNHRGHPRILIGRRDEAVRVAEIVKPYLPECCQYKFVHVRPLPRKGRGRRLSEKQKLAIRQDRGLCTVKVSAQRHGVSLSKVWNLWNIH